MITKAKYVKYNSFCDDDGINDVTLWLWKFSDFSWRHTVGITGDDIMYHILVDKLSAFKLALIWSYM